MRPSRTLLLGLVLPSLLAAQPKRPANAPAAPGLIDTTFAGLAYRNIGPANMSGRIATVTGVPGDPATIYVGSASGGVWKSTNAGTTWMPIFDKQPVQTIGDIVLEPGNPDVVYVGSGEGNPRNSVSFGNGIYKSTDGGKSWKWLGLADSRHIARMVINPRDPRKVYAASLGSEYGPNGERGVFMSEDGGETWKRTLYIDDRHGASDIDIDPQNPNVLYAGMWYFDRKQWTHRSGDEKGGVFKSVDGGKTWTKLTRGIPSLTGRIGVKVAPSNPRMVYAVIESKEGFVFRSDDAGESWQAVSSNANTIGRGFYYADLRVDPKNEHHVYTIGMSFMHSLDGGRTFVNVPGNFHGDHQALWIDPQNPKRLLMGDDGGLEVSYDGAGAWEWFGNLPVGQFYQLSYDMREPFYHVTGGLQDNGVWTGPTRTRKSSIYSWEWRFIQFGDGYYGISHPDDPDWFLSDYQAGGIQATHLGRYEVREASPQPKRMDGYSADSNTVRFNWNAPIVPSPHDGRIVYFGGSTLFRSADWGRTWTALGGDLSKNDKSRQGDAGGPILKENTVAEYYGTIYSFAESPVKKGVLWAGTDDGNLQVSQDDGRTWANVAPNVPGVGADAVVSGIEASRTAAGTAYVTFERHMSDDFKPYAFKTTDFGKTWTNITGNLPANAYAQVIREDPKNPSLLYYGSEYGLFASWTGGTQWTKLSLKNLPNVAVHEVLVHPRDNDLVVATHGRALWVFDDASPIQQMSADVAGKPVHLFPMRAAMRYNTGEQSFNYGHKQYRGQNAQYGALITYWLTKGSEAKTSADSTVRIEILKDGAVIRRLRKVSASVGFNRVAWDLRMAPSLALSDTPADSLDEEGARGRVPGPQVLPGTYTVRITAFGQTQEQPLVVKLDPTAKFADGEVKAQFEQATRMVATVNTLIETERGLAAFAAQAEERARTANTLRAAAARDLVIATREELRKLDSIRLQLTRPTSDVAPYYSEGPRPLQRASALLSNVDNGLTPLIPGQMEYSGEVRRDADVVITMVDTQIQSTATRLNPMLEKLDMPKLVVPTKKPVAM
ncbi:WD40/YVTN/BNR-like repeat-containing protein [Gemmatimonas sp.]|jgi:photosystem II stability/assembly factor-like uncharacterized protein|uniref:WD40/YVTN/BNR-like repeat-containing protein n=1 Tax=Gemmatimonas sp. TaxID=1962908 RepID=UPI0037C05378